MSTRNALYTRYLEDERQDLEDTLQSLIDAIPDNPADDGYMKAVDELVEWLDVDAADHLVFIGGQLWQRGPDECLKYASDPDHDLVQLNRMREEIPEWDDGVTLIPESELEDYAEEQVHTKEDLSAWPFCHIDWAAAAKELVRYDYDEVEYQGTIYYYPAR